MCDRDYICFDRYGRSSYYVLAKPYERTQALFALNWCVCHHTRTNYYSVLCDMSVLN